MKKIIIAVIAIIILYFIGTYNSLINLNESVVTQESQIKNQLQRRFDLIPNLIESVKGVMSQEKEIFTALAEARKNYTGSIESANQLNSSLGKLIAVAENYPQLKSSEAVQTLMIQLEGTENRISVERKNYNDVVKNFNTKVKYFPSNIIAGMLGYEAKAYFESEEAAKVVPKVNFK